MPEFLYGIALSCVMSAWNAAAFPPWLVMCFTMTCALSALVRTARAAFERGGGALAHVPGGTNPADLGHHRD